MWRAGRQGRYFPIFSLFVLLVLWLPKTTDAFWNFGAEAPAKPQAEPVEYFDIVAKTIEDWYGGMNKYDIEELNVQLLETGGPHPVVYGDWLKATGKPTVLIFGHYDVQPPASLWTWNNPYDVYIEDERYYGKGVAGGKGSLLMAVQGGEGRPCYLDTMSAKAVEALMRTSENLSGNSRISSLPVNVKFLFEGQGEINSPGLQLVLEQHKALLAADVCLSAVGGPSPKAETQAQDKVSIPNSTIDTAAAKAWQMVMGSAPAYNRDPAGTAALAALHSVLNIPISVFGWGLGKNINQPDELLELDLYDKGRLAWVRLLLLLGEEGTSAALQETVAVQGDEHSDEESCAEVAAAAEHEEL